MGLRRLRVDSVADFRRQRQETADKDRQLAEQAETIELLKGCIMELADVVYAEEVPA